MKLYRISLCIKRMEDRYLARDGSRLKWVLDGKPDILEVTKEEALLYVEAILKAKLPEDPHELGGWSILKLQACTYTIREVPEEFEWTLTEQMNPVYIGLCWTDDEYHETQWALELNESQIRTY